MKLKNKSIVIGTLVLLLPAIFLASCDQALPTSPVQFSICLKASGCTAEVVEIPVGAVLEIKLPANPSTGYSWEVGFFNPSVLEPFGEPEFSSASEEQEAGEDPYGEPDYSSASYALGAEDIQKLYFEAVGEGESELVLVYRRSFEDAGEDQEEVLKVLVIVK